MTEEKTEWMVSGDCVEACTSPAVCPYYWGSSTPKDLHDGHNRCEGAFSFRIREGCYRDIDLAGLIAGFGFNSAEGGTASRDPWYCILYIDEKADAVQAKALEDILTQCWGTMGRVIAVKRAPMTFLKEKVGGQNPPGYRHAVTWGDAYSMKAEPLMSVNGFPRYVSGMMNGAIYVGRSTENRMSDPDLPRTNWDRPGMSNTYYEFVLTPRKLSWVP